MNLGLGAYLKKHGYQEPFLLMQRHVKRVMEIAEKYQFRPMMWSDMYFRCASQTNDYYEENLVIPPSVIDSAPRKWNLYTGTIIMQNSLFTITISSFINNSIHLSALPEACGHGLDLRLIMMYF